jgi:uncharacterized protein with FMN-binding domain
MKFELKSLGLYEVTFRRADSGDKTEKSRTVIADNIIDSIKLVKRANPERWHYWRVEVVSVKLVGAAWGAP